MAGYVTNIEKKSLENQSFRQVLFTGPNSQLVLMAIAPGDDIGLETHHDHDQFLRIEAGTGKAILNGEEHIVEDGSAIVVPAGVEHNVINTSKSEWLKVYTIYSPPEHPDGTIHKTKAEAEACEKAHHQ